MPNYAHRASVLDYEYRASVPDYAYRVQGQLQSQLVPEQRPRSGTL